MIPSPSEGASVAPVQAQEGVQKTPLASEQGHWYTQDGQPMYEVPYADPRKGMRATTIADAKKLSLVPSVTAITRCAAAPGLDAWKAAQLLESALTLPKIDGETLDDYAKRVVEDSKAQSEKAREAGTALHKAIELYIGGEMTSSEWEHHLAKLDMTLAQYGINIKGGKPEHCFASPLGWGGKLDFITDDLVCDFKTKEVVAGNNKRLAYDEHVMQLAAYGFGIGLSKFRGVNVFIGTRDQEIRIVEHEWEELERGYGMFKDLFAFWCKKNRFGKNGGTP